MPGADTISFARGAPSLDIVDVEGLKAAAAQAFESDPAGTTAFGTAIGYPPLREWIAEQHDVESDQVVVTNGSMQADAFLGAHPLPFEHARSLLWLGQVERRHRRLRAAKQALDGAITVFTELGAVPWIDRARTQLEIATGGRRGPAELTVRERQIADLVVDGASTAEIAAALGIAPKTVEHHLGAVYRKLGVRTRRQLTSVLPNTGANPDPKMTDG